MAPKKTELTEDVVGTLVQGVSALVEEQTRRGRDIPLHELRPITPWNPTGELRTKKYRQFYQNGAKLNHDLMTEEELDLFQQIRPGRYNHRKWEVIRRRDKSLDLRYPNASLDQRMDLKGETSGKLATMLKQILIEQEQQAERRRLGQYDEEAD